MPTLTEDFNELAALVEESKPKAVRPDRVWRAIKRKLKAHKAIEVQKTQDNIRELRGSAQGDAKMRKTIKAMDALMKQYGAAPSVKRAKWEGGRQVIRSYRSGTRYVAMMRLKEERTEDNSIWSIKISVPKR